jgi:hypothetical protein
LRSLSPWAGAFSGGAIAICWLTKGSGLLLLPLFVGCQCLGIAIKFIHRDSSELKARCFSVLLACVAFATVGGTYGWHSYKLYGSPIYNANQRYMWTNNFSHYKAVWKAKKSGVDLAKNVDPSAGDRFAKWGVDGPSLGLTAREWFARNGWDGVGKRLRSGLRRNWQILTGSKHTYGCHIFLAVGTALIVLGVVCRRRRAGVLLKQYGLPLCGFIGMLAAYWLFYAWYTPVAWGGRFIASLFLPYYFCLFITWTKLTEGCSQPVQWAMPFAQALVLAYWLVFIMPVVILRYNGG